MDIFEKIKEIVSRQLELDDSFEISEETDFSQMGLDSLDMVELIMSIEEEFDTQIPDEEMEKMHSFGDVVRYIEKVK